MAGRRSLSETHGNSYVGDHYTACLERDARIPYLDPTFNHEAFESLDTSIDQGTQLTLVEAMIS